MVYVLWKVGKIRKNFQNSTLINIHVYILNVEVRLNLLYNLLFKETIFLSPFH
jgi:hypothetical protein